jgi:hypothetical protein
MSSCQCEGIESRFDAAYAAQKLERYRSLGPDATTHALLDALSRSPPATSPVSTAYWATANGRAAVRRAGLPRASDEALIRPRSRQGRPAYSICMDTDTPDIGSVWVRVQAAMPDGLVIDSLRCASERFVPHRP